MGKKSKRPKRKTKFGVKETKPSTAFGAALGTISLVTVIVLVYLTFAAGGEVSVSYAFAGVLASIFSVIGLVLSILCMNDQYQPHTLGWYGMITSSIAVVSMAGILYLGML